MSEGGLRFCGMELMLPVGEWIHEEVKLWMKG